MDILKSFKVLKNSSAKRWVRNVLAYQFEVAYFLKNIKEAKRLCALLKNDEWKLEFKNDNKFTSDLDDHARILILEGNFKQAATEFKKYIYEYIGNLEERKKREVYAPEYLDTTAGQHVDSDKLQIFSQSL